MMMRKGMWIFLLVALILLPGLVFAGGRVEGATAKGPIKILFIPFTMEHVFQKEMCDGAKIPMEGTEVIVEDPYGKIERELEILETYKNRGIQGVIMYPIDSQALKPIVQELKDKKIWIFTTGNHVEGEDLGMRLDERNGGLLAGDMFIRWWEKNKPGVNPNIILLDIPRVPEPQKKIVAFQEVISKKYPKAQFIHVDSNGETEPALTGVEQTLRVHPEINFIYGINASATLGGIAACENAGRLDIAHASSGAEPPILTLMKKPLSPQGGGVVWDIGYGQSAVQYGYQIVEVAAEIIRDGKIGGRYYDIGFQEVWRENVDKVIATMQEWRKKANLSPMEF